MGKFNIFRVIESHNKVLSDFKQFLFISLGAG